MGGVGGWFNNAVNDVRQVVTRPSKANLGQFLGTIFPGVAPSIQTTVQAGQKGGLKSALLTAGEIAGTTVLGGAAIGALPGAAAGSGSAPTFTGGGPALGSTPDFTLGPAAGNYVDLGSQAPDAFTLTGAESTSLAAQGSTGLGGTLSNLGADVGKGVAFAGSLETLYLNLKRGLAGVLQGGGGKAGTTFVNTTPAAGTIGGGAGSGGTSNSSVIGGSSGIPITVFALFATVIGFLAYKNRLKL